MELLALLAFALALNLDSFAVGVAYGVRNIKMPVTSLTITSIMSMIAITISMLLGNVVAGNFSSTFVNRLGGAILLFIGIWILIQSLRENNGKKANANFARGIKNETDIQIHIRTLGIVIQVPRELYRANMDQPSVMSRREVALLGMALAIDSFVAGFAVSMMGFNILYTTLGMGLGHFILTHFGLKIGKGFGTSRLNTKLTILPGFILIALGLFKIC